MTTVLSVVNQKGGVGKTATAFNVGPILGELGKRVLLIDLDPQTSLTLSFGIDPTTLNASMYDVLINREQSLAEVLITTSCKGVDLAPAHIDLAVIAMNMRETIAREKLLRKKLAPVLANYDYVMIDCAPSLDLLVINALTASNATIVPVQTEPLALYGLQNLLNTIASIQEDLNPHLTILGLLPTMYDSRIASNQDVLKTLKDTFGDLVFKSIVRRRAKLTEGALERAPITVYATSSAAAKDYREVAKELIERARA